MFSFILLYHLVVEDARFFTGAYLLRNVEDPLVLRRSSPECTMLGQTMQCWRNKFTTCYHGDTSAEFFIFSHLDTRTLYLFAGPNRRMLQLNGENQCNAVTKSQVDQAISSISCTTFCTTRHGMEPAFIGIWNLVYRAWLKGGPQVA